MCSQYVGLKHFQTTRNLNLIVALFFSGSAIMPEYVSSTSSARGSDSVDFPGDSGVSTPTTLSMENITMRSTETSSAAASGNDSPKLEMDSEKSSSDLFSNPNQSWLPDLKEVKDSPEMVSIILFCYFYGDVL